MSERFIVVDLETTGQTVSKGAEIIEIGIIVLEGQTIVNEYKTKVKPKAKVPPFITHLTGITNEDLRDAPSFEEIAPDLRHMFSQGYFVAHNVPFDFTFLNESFQQVGLQPIDCLTIDTVELARLCFPKAPSYKLSDITDYLGIEHFSPHRALSDAYVTSQLWLHEWEKLAQLPFRTLTMLRSFIPFLHSQIEEWFDRLVEQKRYKYNQPYQHDDHHDVSQVRHDDVELAFSDWLNDMNQRLPYTLREKQYDMANHIWDHINQSAHFVVEAGAGLGKTQAYLLPTLYEASKGKRTLISTSTIQLQHQLVHEAHQLVDDLKLPPRVTLIKSPRHYIHYHRFMTYIDHFSDHHNYDAVLTATMLLVWLTETETGDVDELNLPTNGQQIWHYINCDNPHTSKEGSYFHRALDVSKQSDCVVVNHAFLLQDRLKQQRLLDVDTIIIDEAHQLENTARHQFARQLNYVDIVHLLQDLEPLLTWDTLEQTRQLADSFFRAIYQAVEFLYDDDLVTDTGKAQLILDDETEDLVLQGDINDQYIQLNAMIDQVIDEIEQQVVHHSWYELLRREAVEQLFGIKGIFAQYFANDGRDVKWIEMNQFGAKNAATLHLEPVSVADWLHEQLFQSTVPVILTSATLQMNHDFHIFMSQTGIPQQTDCLVLESPFHYQSQVRMYTPNHLAEVSKSDIVSYTSQVSDFIIQYYVGVQHKMLVLFTSFDMLRLVYKQLKRSNRLEHVTVIGQGVTTGSRDKLKKMFESNDDVILLGTHSFWEGFDVNDDSFKTVCMVRLPFEMPSSPLMQAKRQAMGEQSYNDFYHLALPIAVQRFRQAFGRMIRHESNRAVFLVLDQRLYTKRYGSSFLNALPDVHMLHSEPERIITDAKKWLS
ncbi:ATP-dependent DNA helicase DinG [Alkalibacillus flavidus]|uniref:3'-5' exonuclease DinG n=1 Tax=Alkalibacillus flavidus TaxID=546021 RepID=A0ABV2KRV7_9BACI